MPLGLLSPSARLPFIQVRSGVSRSVLLVGPLAVKVPFLGSWKRFLYGLLSNLHERQEARRRLPRTCPVLLSDPLGLLVLMPRCAPLPEGALTPELYQEFTAAGVQAEPKPCSFGVLRGEVVALDYHGNYA